MQSVRTARRGRIVMSKALVLGAAALVFSAAGAWAADLVAPRYGYAAPADVATALVTAPPVYAAPVYTRPTVYAAPVYAAPPVYPAPQVYTAPPVTSGYYAPHPVPPDMMPRLRVSIIGEIQKVDLY